MEIDFTRREQNTKCMSFEIKPIGNTRDTIDRLGIIERDVKRDELRIVVMKAYDSFTKKVIDNVLSKYDYDWDTLFNAKTNKDNKKSQALVKDATQKLVKTFYTEVADMAGCPFDSAAFSGKFLPKYTKEAEDLSDDEKEQILKAIDFIGSAQPIFSKIAISRMTSLKKAADRVFENFDTYIENARKFEYFFANDKTGFIDVFPETETCVEPSYYSQCLRQSGIDAYNSIISGIFNDDGESIAKGYNATVAELNIALKHDKENNLKPYQKCKKLYKQVLFPIKSAFSIEYIENDDDAKKVVAETRRLVTEKSLGDIYTLVKNADPAGITLTWNMLGAFARLMYDDAHYISDLIRANKLKELEEGQMRAETKSDKGKFEKRINNIEKELLKTVFSLSEIGTICENEHLQKEYAKKLLELRDNVTSFDSDLDLYRVCDEGVPLRTNRERVTALNNYYGAVTDFLRAINLIRKAPEDEKSDPVFYETLSPLCDCLYMADKAHNKIRNYVTKNLGDIAKKIQLYIKNETCWTKGDGSDRPEREISILKKAGKYYFATKPQGSRGFNYGYVDDNFVGATYDILTQSKGQKAEMFLPNKVFAAAELTDGCYVVTKNMNHPVIISSEIYNAYANKVYDVRYEKNGYTENEHRNAVCGIIKTYQEFIANYKGYEKYNIVTKPAEQYSSIKDFYDDVDCTKFLIEWKKVEAASIDKAVEDGKLLMFLITNRELYRTEQTRKHTYAKQFLALISEENMKNPAMQLNADPQVFWRDAVIPRKVTHPKGSILVDIYDNDGNRVPDDIREELYRHLNGKMDGMRLSDEAKAYKDKAKYYTAKWDIIKDERYTREQFSLTLSYTTNRAVPSSAAKRNTVSHEVAESLADKNVLTVVRGFDHLIYCRVTNKDGFELYSDNLDTFDRTNYRNLLLNKTFERRNEKKDWANETTIKAVRTGYIDKAISEIIRISQKYDAVILIEGFSDQYKDKAAAFDNQVFKTFETRLRTRLASHIDVDAGNGEAGSPLNPLQYISSGMNNNCFQNGILFKINAAYTKNVCPMTGFVNVFDTSNVNGIAQKRNFLSKFKEIKYDNGFKFIFDYNDFPVKHILKKTEWTVDCTTPKTQWNAEKRKYEYSANASDKVCALLDKDSIDYKNANILDLIEDGLAGKYINALYELFTSTINYPMVRKCKEVEESYYSSPVVKTEMFGISQEQLIAINLEKKFKFHLSDSNIKEGDYSDNWLNYNIGLYAI